MLYYECHHLVFVSMILKSTFSVTAINSFSMPFASCGYFAINTIYPTNSRWLFRYFLSMSSRCNFIYDSDDYRVVVIYSAWIHRLDSFDIECGHYDYFVSEIQPVLEVDISQVFFVSCRAPVVL